MERIEVSDGLLFRYLDGNVSESEKTLVEQWLQSAENRDRLEQLKLIKLLTEVKQPEEADVEAAWMKMRQKAVATHNARKTIAWKPAYTSRMAATLLLGLAIYTLAQFYGGKNNSIGNYSSEPVIAEMSETSHDTNQVLATASPKSDTTISDKEIVKASAENTLSRNTADKSTNTIASADKKKEAICNNTQCALEICIRQALGCGNAKGNTIAYCSFLEPDESGMLHYQAFDNNAKDCKAVVQEIKIRRVSTGEQIVLDDKTDVTAQDFFDYMTGEKTGDVVAGIFETDCNNYCSDQHIKLDNRLGVPVLQ